MKTLQTLLIVLLLSAGGFKASAQCDATFTADTTALGTFSFTPNGYGNYRWHFGDGDTSNIRQPQHSFPATGNYNVCLIITDSAGTCADTSCQTVQVQPCQVTSNKVTASFTDVNQGYTVDFTNTSTGSYPPLTYSWVTSHGTPLTSTATNPVITFPAGSQYVWLTAVDALGCQGQFATNIQVNGNLPCNAQFLYNYVSLGVYSFVDSNALVGYTYLWNFGDGGTSTEFNPTHTFATNGTYNVCLIVTNAGSACADTFCEPMNVQACGTYASFTETLSGLQGNRISYTSTSTTANPPLTYQWSFSGDSVAASTSTDPVLQLSGHWIENASLTVTDANGCSASANASTDFGGPISNQIIGQLNNVPTCPVTVYLILEDTIGHLTLVDSITFVDTLGGCIDSVFRFNITVPGTYFVKAALQPSNPNYAGILPTYYYDTLSWAGARAMYVTSGSNNYYPWINMIAGVNTGGPGFIGGWVSQGAGLNVRGSGNSDTKGLGDPLAGVQIDLITDAGQAVAYTFTDANGEYRFNNLAYGTYVLFADELNKIPSFITVTLSADQPVDSTVNMSINSHYAVATGVEDLTNLSIDRVYPDPVEATVNLDVTSTTETPATLKLIDVLGRTQLQKPVTLTTGNNHFEVDMQALTNGVYQLILLTGTKQVGYKLVKVK